MIQENDIEKILEVICENSRKNPEYIRCRNRTIELGCEIMERLRDKRSLFLEYEEVTALAEGIRLENACLITKEIA
ncbi:MAG: hypothetical protein ACYDEJ_09525 [Desulfitobacteriaceae bacterium]